MTGFGAYDTTALKGLALIRKFGGPACTYTPTVGPASTPTLVSFRFNDGPENRPAQATGKVRAADVSAPVVGDYYVLTGDSQRWQVFDVHEHPGHFVLNSRAVSEVTHTAKGGGADTTVNAIVADLGDSGDPTPELRAAKFTICTAEVNPDQGDLVTDGDSTVWMLTSVDRNEAFAECAARETTLGDYTTAEGTTTEDIYSIFRYFVGNLDDLENALLIVSNADISNPNEGDYYVIDGDSARWYVLDVRERDDLFELRVARTKDRT